MNTKKALHLHVIIMFVEITLTVFVFKRRRTRWMLFFKVHMFIAIFEGMSVLDVADRRNRVDVM